MGAAKVEGNVESAASVLARNCVYAFGRFTDYLGNVEPIYISLMRLLGNPGDFSLVLRHLESRIREYGPDLIAGVVSAGVPFSAGLTLTTGIPSILVRNRRESHGEGDSIQGNFRRGHSVVIVDDAIGDGRTKASVAEELAARGLDVRAALAVWSCGCPPVGWFQKHEIPLEALVSHKEVVDEMETLGMVPVQIAELIRDVYDQPERWEDERRWKTLRRLCESSRIPWSEPSYW